MSVFYRNTVDLVSNEGIEVEETSLWVLNKDSVLELVDEDQYVTAPLDDRFRESVLM
jgi:hypothetical protein